MPHHNGSQGLKRAISDSYDPEIRQYVNGACQIYEALIQENYILQNCIEAFLSFGNGTLACHESFPVINVLLDALVDTYPDTAA